MYVQPVIGFVGLGVMGGAMCRNIALKHPGDVIAFDMSSAAFAAEPSTPAASVALSATTATPVGVTVKCCGSAGHDQAASLG